MKAFLKPFSEFIRKAFAFVRRDFFIQTSYRLSFFVHWLGVLVSIFTLYYLSKLIGKSANPYLANYGGEYFPFIVIGVAAANYIGTSLSSFSSGVTNEQWSGTLEIMLTTPTKISTIVFSMSLYSFLFATVNVFLYLFVATFFLGAHFHYSNQLAIIIILLLTIISFSSIGIISASFIILFKKGEPLVGLMNGVLWFFGGVYFPITIFPKYIQAVSYCLPITYSLRALRLALLEGHSISLLKGDILILLCFCIVLLPLSFIIFKKSIKLAKKTGSLAFY